MRHFQSWNGSQYWKTRELDTPKGMMLDIIVITVKGGGIMYL